MAWQPPTVARTPGEPVPGPRACPPTRRHDRQQAPSGGGHSPRAVAAIGVGWYAAAGWALVFAGRGVYWALGGTVGLDPFARHPTGSPSRERALLAARDIAILKAVGMSPRQLLAIWVSTASAVLGVIGGLFALPLGVRTYHGLMTQLARQVGNRAPPSAFEVLHPTTLYPLGVMGLAIALAGAVFPARRAARSRAAAILRSE